MLLNGLGAELIARGRKARHRDSLAPTSPSRLSTRRVLCPDTSTYPGAVLGAGQRFTTPGTIATTARRSFAAVNAEKKRSFPAPPSGPAKASPAAAGVLKLGEPTEKPGPPSFGRGRQCDPDAASSPPGTMLNTAAEESPSATAGATPSRASSPIWGANRLPRTPLTASTGRWGTPQATADGQTARLNPGTRDAIDGSRFAERRLRWPSGTSESEAEAPTLYCPGSGRGGA